MKKTEAKEYKTQLLALRARLRGDVSQLADAALKKNGAEVTGNMSTMPIHMADLGSDNFEQEFSLSLMENDETTLGAIEGALERIDLGIYGDCEECGTKIPKTRLQAIPYTALCVKCASKSEASR
jgi:RNA polymerase-binding transcription factor DksA